LAGSERASQTKNRGLLFVEGSNINKSLLALGNCINSLASSTPKSHIPYRNSKLTRLLKDSLGGNCKTVMIANVSPSILSYEDTHKTLEYANRAKAIKTKVSRTYVDIDTHVTQVVSVLRAEVTELRQKLKAAEEKNVTDTNTDNKQVEYLNFQISLMTNMLKEQFYILQSNNILTEDQIIKYKNLGIAVGLPTTFPINDKTLTAPTSIFDNAITTATSTVNATSTSITTSITTLRSPKKLIQTAFKKPNSQKEKKEVRFNLSPEKLTKAKAIPKTFPSKIPQSPMIGQNKAVRVLPQSPLPPKQQQLQLNLTPKTNKLPLSTKIGSSLGNSTSHRATVQQFLSSYKQPNENNNNNNNVGSITSNDSMDISSTNKENVDNVIDIKSDTKIGKPKSILKYTLRSTKNISLTPMKSLLPVPTPIKKRTAEEDINPRHTKVFVTRV